MSEASDYRDYQRLCDRVEKIDAEAAKWLREEAPKMSGFEYYGDLDEVLSWEKTPQGHDFWSTIDEKLHLSRQEMIEDFFKPIPPINEPITLADGTVIRPADAINHPVHYVNGPACPHCGNTIECITVTEEMGFCLGNVVKYIWRRSLKGDTLKDLKKARWYLDREIQRMESK